MIGYEEMVGEFRHMTRGIWPDTERCCLTVRDGAPECCYQIVDGADLTFTAAEAECVPDDVALTESEDGLLVLDRAVMTPEQITHSLRSGSLADTLECASHPTRPVVLPDGSVVAVVVIDACNGPLLIDRYRAMRKQFHRLWTAAVDQYGIKPYYVTHSMRKGWQVL